MRNFFISYNQRDREAAARIDQQLRDAGYSTTFQLTDMPPGASVPHEMDKAIKNNERLIAVLSPDYLESRYCASEWEAFQHKDPTGEKRAIIPVIVRRCEIQGLLSVRARVDLVGTDPSEARTRLLEAVAAVLQDRDPPSRDAIIDSLGRYLAHLRKHVSTVRMFGDETPHELEHVFVELSINQDYDRHSNQAEVLGFMDAEARRLRSVFGGKELLRRPVEADVSDRGTILPDDLLRHHSHTVITGAPGCGKTTLLRYLAWQAVKQFAVPLGGDAADADIREAGVPHGRLPVFLELKQLTAAAVQQSGGYLEKLLLAEGIAATIKPDDAERRVLEERFHALLKEGRVLVLLDGLDEVTGTSFFRDLQAAVYNFLQSDCGTNTVIISTRPFASRKIGDVRVLEIQPLTGRQIARFIEHYLPDTPERRTLQRELQDRPELKELARVPALLGFILQLLKASGGVAEDKLDLYARITSKLAQQLDTDKQGIAPDRQWLVEDRDGSLKHDLLRRLAFNQLFRGLIRPPFAVGAGSEVTRLVFTSDQLRAEAVEFARSIKEDEGFNVNPRSLADDLKATAMLRQVGVDHFAFAHLTLQEYLAATVLAKRADCEAIVCRAIFKARLAEMEVLPMALGMVPDAGVLYDSLAQLPESLNVVNHRVRLRGLCYAATLSRATAAELIEWLVRPIKDQRSDETPYLDSTYDAFASAGGSAKELLVERLRELSKNGSGDVRDDALEKLGAIGGDRVVDDLCAALNDRHDFVRESAVRALVGIGSPSAEHGLQKALRDDSAAVRKRAEAGLRQLKGESTETEGSVTMSWMLPRPASGAPGSKEEVDECIRAIRAPFGSSEMRATEKLGWGMSDDEVATLLRMLMDLGGWPAYGPRLAVAYAFERFSSENLTRGLVLALDGCHAPMVRRKAAEVLGYSASDPAVQRELERVAETDPMENIRSTARAALEKYRRKLRYFEAPP
jgi:HEAT repeat protein